MLTQIWVNIESGNGFVLDGTRPSPGPILIHHQKCSVTFTLEQVHKSCSSASSVSCVYRTLFWLLPHFPMSSSCRSFWIGNSPLCIRLQYRCKRGLIGCIHVYICFEASYRILSGSWQHGSILSIRAHIAMAIFDSVTYENHIWVTGNHSAERN